MPDHNRYAENVEIVKRNYKEGRKRIEQKLGTMPLNCEDSKGNIKCKWYALCQEVRTYERGGLAEPLCVLSNDEVEEFVVEWRDQGRRGARHKVA